MEKQKTKILVFRYRFLGDTILTVPFLKRLKELHPNSHIAVLVAPQSGVLLQNCPYVDELIEFDTTRFHKYDSGKSSAKSFWGYAFELRNRKFDIAYVLKRSFSSAFLAWVAGIKERIGFDTEHRGFLLTKKIDFDANKHEVINFLNHLPEQYKQPPSKEEVLFWPTEEEKQKAQLLMSNLLVDRKKVLIHAPSAHPQKMWSKEKWAELVIYLKKQNHYIVASGAPSDKDYYCELETLVQKEINDFWFDVNLCETQTNLRENVAVYSLCDFAVCVDSGPMHLAAAVNVPIVALFGPSSPQRWSPWSNSNEYEIVSSRDGVVDSIDSAEVIEAFHKVETPLENRL